MNNTLRCAIVLLIACSHLNVMGQDLKGIRSGMTSEQTLRAIVNPSLYSATAAFDGRYEGVKGSPRLIDSLVPSTVRLNGYKELFEVSTDIDVVRNTLLFILGSSGDMLEVPSSYIDEVTFHFPGGEKVFRTTAGLPFDREIRGNRFYQQLAESPRTFIKIPDREFLEANFTGLYSPDIRYDEYVTSDKYYIMGDDSILHRIQLTRKSLVKLFPAKGRLINSTLRGKKGTESIEEAVISILDKL